MLAMMGSIPGIPGIPDPKSLLGEGSREQQLHNFKNAVLERVKSATDLVARKASPAELDAYRKMPDETTGTVDGNQPRNTSENVERLHRKRGPALPDRLFRGRGYLQRYPQRVASRRHEVKGSRRGDGSTRPFSVIQLR